MNGGVPIFMRRNTISMAMLESGFAQKLAEIKERWSNLRRGQRPLSPDDIAREVAAIGDRTSVRFA